MVKRQLILVSNIITLLLIGSFNLAIASTMQPKLILILDKNESILGRPIRAELYGISLKTKISDVKLSRLEKDFGVVVDYIVHDTLDKRWPNSNVQILKFKLYPRRMGNLIVPHLTDNNINSNTTNIIIKSGTTSVPKIQISTRTPYERQQIIVQASIESNDSTSRLSVKENISINGATISTLPFAREKKSNGNYILRIGWSIMPLKTGEIELKLPPIEYSVSGVSRKQFHLPYKNIDIKALPAYLPPTITVGGLQIKSYLPTAWALQTDSVVYWNIELSGQVNNTYSLPAVLRQIKSTNHVKFFPADINRYKEATTNNFTSTTKYTIPFKISNSGFTKLPDIKVQYFDPNGEKIKTLVHKTKSIFVLSLFWRAILGVVWLALLLYIINVVYKKALKIKNSLKKRNNALALLAKTQSIEEVKESIKLLSDAESWPQNSTLKQWATYWSGKYKVEDNFEDFINDLSLCFYNPEKNRLQSELSLKLLQLVKNRKHKKRFFIG